MSYINLGTKDICDFDSFPDLTYTMPSDISEFLPLEIQVNLHLIIFLQMQSQVYVEMVWHWSYLHMLGGGLTFRFQYRH